MALSSNPLTGIWAGAADGGDPRTATGRVRSVSGKATAMRKLIENVIAYPIDCEVRLGSVAAALLTSQNRDGGV